MNGNGEGLIAGAKLTEDDQVLSDTGVDHVHGAHGAAGVVEYPFFLVGVDPYLRGWVGCG